MRLSYEFVILTKELHNHTEQVVFLILIFFLKILSVKVCEINGDRVGQGTTQCDCRQQLQFLYFVICKFHSCFDSVELYFDCDAVFFVVGSELCFFFEVFRKHILLRVALVEVSGCSAEPVNTARRVH